MARPRNEIPTYRRDTPRDRGKAVVCGRPVYFPGEFNSPESLLAYQRWLAEYLAAAPLDFKAGATIEVLALVFMEQFVEPRFRKNGRPTSEVSSYRVAMRPVVELYGTTPAASFTPRSLRTCRDQLVRAGYTRIRINGHVQRIRRMFRWGVAEGIVPEAVWRTLTALEGLRKDEGGVEQQPTVPADEALVDAVKPYVTPPIWAAIQFQMWTACRPGEALAIKSSNTLADDPILPAAVRSLCWVYRPGSHKTEHHGRGRLILIGPQAQAIIEPWLRPADPEAYLFNPVEARRWADRKRKKNARPNLTNAKPTPTPARQIAGSHYTVWSYSRAIRRACERAAGMPSNLIEVPRRLKGTERAAAIAAAKAWRREHKGCYWHPHQLRHNAATKIRATYGIEVARIILGHARMSATEIYAERDLVAAAQAIAAMG
ncbi:MAG: site-specific integrase [Planctomycetota bacterium]